MSKNNKKKINKKWVIIGVVIVVIIGLFVITPAKKINVITATVKKSDIKAYVSQQAKTELKNIYKITMPFSSRLNVITLRAGSPVKKGEVVAAIVNTEINAEYSAAKADLQSINAQIKLNEYRNFATTALKESLEWIKTMQQLQRITQIKITASQHALEYAIQHKNALIQSGRAVSRIEKNQAEMEAAVKEVELESSRLANTAMTIFTDIWKLLPIYINEYIKTLDIKKEILLGKKIKAESALTIVKNNLDMSVMKSPVDGLVLKRYVCNERYLQKGQCILDIGTMKDLEVVAEVLTTEVMNVKKGDKVQIVSSAGITSALSGTVSEIEPQGFTDISSLGVKQQKVIVKIAFNKGELNRIKKAGFSYGAEYRVYIKIYTSEAQNALIAPRTAIFKGANNQWKVFTVENGKAKLHTVKVGILNDEFVQITLGIKNNDTVILSPPTNIINNTKVKSINSREK